jgi:hypothetical protein
MYDFQPHINIIQLNSTLFGIKLYQDVAADDDL